MKVVGFFFNLTCALTLNNTESSAHLIFSINQERKCLMEHVITLSCLSCQGLTVEAAMIEHVLHISNSNGEGALLKTLEIPYLRICVSA